MFTARRSLSMAAIPSSDKRFDSGQPIVAIGLRAITLADPAFQPISVSLIAPSRGPILPFAYDLAKPRLANPEACTAS